MRDFEPCYSDTTGKWSVIARDPEDGHWWALVPDCGNKLTALDVARALRELERGKAEAVSVLSRRGSPTTTARWWEANFGVRLDTATHPVLP